MNTINTTPSTEAPNRRSMLVAPPSCLHLGRCLDDTGPPKTQQRKELHAIRDRRATRLGALNTGTCISSMTCSGPVEASAQWQWHSCRRAISRSRRRCPSPAVYVSVSRRLVVCACLVARPVSGSLQDTHHVRFLPHEHKAAVAELLAARQPRVDRRSVLENAGRGRQQENGCGQGSHPPSTTLRTDALCLSLQAWVDLPRVALLPRG